MFDTDTNPAESLVDALNLKFPVINSWDKPFSLTVGRKWTKIIHGGYVYGFVDNITHELIKAASWAKPALNARGETAGKYFIGNEEGFNIAMFNADLHAGFLYKEFPVQEPVNA